MTSPARPASEPEASQAARLGRQNHDRRAWLDAVHVPRRWSLRRWVERGSDARPAVVGFGRPAVVRPRLRYTRHRARLGHPPSTDLLAWSGGQVDEYYASLDLRQHGSVIWAGSDPVLLWFDLGRDMTERWVHQQ